MKHKNITHQFDPTDPLDMRDKNAGSATRNGQLEADNKADKQTDQQQEMKEDEGDQSRLIKNLPGGKAFENIGPRQKK